MKNKIKATGISDLEALILAAGSSSRFGQPKLLMPWQGTTVIEHIVEIVKNAGIADIHVITGGDRKKIENVLEPLSLNLHFNKDYRDHSMIHSMQIGLNNLGSTCRAVLILLGDQPVVEIKTIDKLVHEFISTNKEIIVPLYQKRKGHPWILGRSHWQEVLNMPGEETLRDFLSRHEKEIAFVPVDTPMILQDFDTYEEYLVLKHCININD